MPFSLPANDRLMTPVVELPSIDEAQIIRLGEEGFFVVDDFLGIGAAREVRAEALLLAASGELRPAGMGRGGGFRMEKISRGDEILWLEPGSATPAIALLIERLEALRNDLNHAAWLGLRRYEIQLARYEGRGTGYVRHFDAFAGGPNRQITALYYLNEGWLPADGGCLRLFPPERAEVELEPVIDRLVVFSSPRIEHEVRPAWAERLAITAWFYGAEALPR